MLLQRENIGMSSGSGKKTFIAVNTVYKQPVRLNMQFPMVFPASFQRMVSIFFRQRSLILKQQINSFLQFIKIISTLRDLFHITLEVRGIKRIKHLYSQLPEKVFSILGPVKPFPLFNGLQRFTGLLIRFCRKRKTLINGNSGHHHTKSIRSGQSPVGKNGTGLFLDGRVNSGANNNIGRHILSPFQYCSPDVPSVKFTTRIDRRASHAFA